ncbi:protease modulator HflC [Butyrivibrio sp. MC2013]|uniref:protease modulator HflC n=1 Tax=Butyrivibrio sp. MC2013 TaxID=1280686 RepID=UPI0004117A54|nr:protease modulator HflC [Butyrivibrio sp. MC2013]
MKKKILILPLAVIAIALFIFYSCTYTVYPKEYAAIRQFGKVTRIESDPGLYFKVPFIETSQFISAATVIYDIPESDVITRDKKSMITNTYVLWKVTDPKKYIQTLNAISDRAQERIEAAVYNATKTEISSMTQEEVIAARGEQLTSAITTNAQEDLEGYGIEILQAEIKALDLPEDNREAVYERMISERQNIAASYTAEGESEAQKIKNETDKQVSIKESAARATAASLEGEGEAEYMKILSEAYNTEDKAEFYNYSRSIEALKNSLSGSEDTIILDKDSELVRILYGNAD